MYTSDIKRKGGLKTVLAYIIASALTALFGAIYELFGYEVYSYFMIYAFAFPLVGGALPMLLLYMFEKIPYPGVAARYMYHSGIAALTVGSLFRGVLDIYGSTNALLNVYWILGGIFILLGIILWLCTIPRKANPPYTQIAE